MSTENVLNEEKGNGVLADVSGSVCTLGQMNCECQSRTYENFLKEGCEHYR